MIQTILDAYTTTGTGSAISLPNDATVRSWQADSGTGDATITVQVSADGSYWQDYFTLSPAADTPDGYSEASSWSFIRAVVSANTGTVNMTVNY